MIEFMESFDKYGTVIANTAAAWTCSNTAGCTLSSTGGRAGSGRYLDDTGSGSETWSRLFKAARASGTVGMIATFGGLPDNVFLIGDGGVAVGNVQLTLNRNGNDVKLYRGTVNTGTLLGTFACPGGIANAVGTYNYFELEYTIHGSAGFYKIWFNGAVIGTASGVNTQNTANATADRLILGRSLGNSGGGNGGRFDDLYIGDAINDVLGPVHIEYQTASGAGTTTQWTPSTGSNYQNIDEDGTNGDADYNSTNTVGNKDTFAIANFSNGGTVKAVQVIGLFRLDDLGSRDIDLVVRSSADNDSPAQAVSSQTYAFKNYVWQTNPDTGVAWTKTEIDAMEAGYKLAS